MKRSAQLTEPEAVERLCAGDLVVLPTETVYGLAAHADRGASIARLFARKGRPPDNPMILHVANKDMALVFVEESALSARGRASFDHLVSACWPGPLTLVLPARESTVLPQIRAGGPTVALRCPVHPRTQRILEAVGWALAMPSANLSGKLSPTTLDAAQALLGDPIVAGVDGGGCAVGLESTVLDLTHDPPRVLRYGSIMPTLRGGHDPIDGLCARTGMIVRSPGVLYRHYAPVRPVRINCEAWPTDDDGPVARLSAGSGPMVQGAHASLGQTLSDIASRWYRTLWHYDRQPFVAIAIQRLPEPMTTGDQQVQRALDDRLRRLARSQD